MIEKAVTLVTTFVPSLFSTVFAYWNYVTSFFDREHDPDATRSVPEIIESRGFKSETHSITTSDGHVLTMFRVVNPFMKRNKVNTYPVVLGHGLALDCTQWLINSDDGHLAPVRSQDGPGTSSANKRNSSSKKKEKRPQQKMTSNLAFLLANEGYDVWLLNFRGSRFSRSHKRLTHKDAKFWDFSNDEIIQQDLPACLNHVIGTTGHEQVGYVGHTLGSIAMFGLLAHQPDFNDKIKPFVAMNPAIAMSRAFGEATLPFAKVRVPIPKMIVNPVLRVADIVLQSFGTGEVKALKYMSRMLAYVSSGNMFQYHLSRGLQKVLSLYYIHSDINSNRLSVYAAQSNAWMSRKQLSHLLQQVTYDEFSRYDYGDNQNKVNYGDADPPLYDLRDVTNTTIALMYAKSDTLSSPEDVESLTSTLKVPIMDEFRIKDPSFTHRDFVYSSRVGELVNPEVLKVLKKVNAVPLENGAASSSTTL